MKRECRRESRAKVSGPQNRVSKAPGGARGVGGRGEEGIGELARERGEKERGTNLYFPPDSSPENLSEFYNLPSTLSPKTKSAPLSPAPSRSLT